MLAILQVVSPVFLVVGAGYLAARLKWFPDEGVDALILFVIRFATPCLLFSAMYNVSLSTAFEWRLLFAYYAPALICFGGTLVVARALGRRPGEAVAIAFGALFSNALLFGLPIMLLAYGEAAAQPAYGVLAMQSPLLFTIGMVAMEVSRRDGTGAWAALRRAARSMASNALMMGVLAGLTLNVAGVRLPGSLENAVDLLAQATLPTALFGLGAALTRYRLQADFRWALGVAAVSLLAHPAMTWLLAEGVFDLEDVYVRAAVVMAAMPPGFNVYVFATMYKRGESVAAGAVLLSTALSIFSVTLWLTLLGGAG